MLGRGIVPQGTIEDADGDPVELDLSRGRRGGGGFLAAAVETHGAARLVAPDAGLPLVGFAVAVLEVAFSGLEFGRHAG